MAADLRDHGASASATGYLFQCRYALFAGLQAIADSPQLAISLETFDDVAFESTGVPIQLIQTKHHVARHGSLTNDSVDLWKTLAIWAELTGEDFETPFRTAFTLLTTGVAPEGSAASFLKPSERDEQKADDLLRAAAVNSKNKQSSQGRAVYTKLPDDVRLNLLKAITILDDSPNIVDLRDEIARSVQHATSRDHLDALVERLEGWWFGVVIKAMSARIPTAISVLAIDRKVDELREQFRRDALPIDYADATPTPEVIAELDKRPFVSQLRRIDIGSRRIEFAIRDYYRASEQRSRWAREALLLDGELASYERQLTEAWEPRYEAMQEDVQGSDERAKISAGQILFKWVEQDAHFALRTVDDHFMTHGSYHILSNSYKVGWHPDFTAEQDASRAEGKQ
jgi:hypothetical protein